MDLHFGNGYDPFVVIAVVLLVGDDRRVFTDGDEQPCPTRLGIRVESSPMIPGAAGLSALPTRR